MKKHTKTLSMFVMLTLLVGSIFATGFASAQSFDNRQVIGNELTNGLENSRYAIGDVNEDGSVNIADVVSINAYLNTNRPGATPTGLSHYDFNQDGMINHWDANELANYLFPSTTGVAGDANGDGNFDVTDVTVMNQYLALERVTVYIDNADMDKNGKIEVNDREIMLEDLFGVGETDAESGYDNGDFNEDGAVDLTDISAINAALLSKEVINPLPAHKDFNNDGVLNFFDSNELTNYLFIQSDRVEGDANGDGNFDISDAVRVQQYLAGQHVMTYIDNADMDRNGRVEMTDSKLMLDHLFPQNPEVQPEKPLRKPNTVNVENVARRVNLPVTDVTNDLNDVKDHESDEGSLDFPVIVYSGYSEDHEAMKFNIFEKKSKIVGDVASSTQTYYTGRIALGDGTQFQIKGESLLALYIDGGYAALNLNDETLVLKFETGEEFKYSLTELDRSPVRDVAPGRATSEIVRETKPVANNNRDFNANAAEVVVEEANQEVKIQPKGFWTRVRNFFGFR